MIDEPVTVVADDFQKAWLEVVRRLYSSKWELRNLVAHVKDPGAMDGGFHQQLETFVRAQNLLGPKHVAYTIFPHGLYRRRGGRELFTDYNRSGGFFERRKTGWGTYFRRMTQYGSANGLVNQLENIISAIRDRENLSKAAYTIVIQIPGGETVRPLGGPCLNYLAIQAERGGPDGNTPTLGMLAVYRNHDFLKRAYGNYWGLCNLIRFLAAECGGTPGPLTCISSHAYVDAKRTELRAFVESC